MGMEWKDCAFKVHFRVEYMGGAWCGADVQMFSLLLDGKFFEAQMEGT